MENHELAVKIVSLLGGKQNINNYWHCVTRLRFTLKEDKHTNLREIERLDGVLGTTLKNNQYQIIIGPNVTNVYNEIESIIGPLSDSGDQDDAQEGTNGKKKISGKMILDVISGVFAPILPALVAGGMLKGILAIFIAFFPTFENNSTMALFNLIADVPFYFLPFLLAISSARKFKVNEFLGICMAGALLYPTFVNSIESGNSGLTLFGLSIPVFNYASSVFPVILGVGLMALVYHFIDQFIPEVLKLVIVPATTLIIVVPIAMWLLAPLGAYGGQYLADGIVWLFDRVGILAGFLLGFFMPLIVLTGMHQSTSPIQIQNIATLGYDYLLPISFVHNMAESGAALGTSLRMKDKKLRAAGVSNSFSAFLGISEPALYTINIVHRTSLISAMIGSGVGGMLTFIFGVKCYAFVMPGITSLPVYAKSGEGFTNILLMIACLVIAFLTSMLTAYVTGNKVASEEKVSSFKQVSLDSPVAGKVISLDEVDDPVFAQGTMGKGFGVKPSSGEIFAPISGEITMIAATKHGIGIETADGLEVLIHMGIDTVELQNDPFEIMVELNEKVTTGQKIAEMDIGKVEQGGKDSTVIVVVTNSEEKLKTFTLNAVPEQISLDGPVVSAELL